MTIRQILLAHFAQPDPVEERWSVDKEIAAIFDKHLGDRFGDGVVIAYRNVLPEIVDWIFDNA